MEKNNFAMADVGHRKALIYCVLKQTAVINILKTCIL